MHQDELRSRIESVLSQQHVLTLSFADEAGPWAAPVFFASGDRDAFDLYFVTNPSSRHGRAIESGAELAAAVHAGTSEWADIKGLQMSGKAEQIADKAALEAARGCYMRRFPFTEVFFRQEELLEPEVREMVARVRFYQYRPSSIVLVDNSVHFGFHEKLEI